MNDLIKRQDVIDAINHYLDEVKNIPMGTAFKEVVKDGYCRIRSIIMSLPSAQQWTPCSEGLPKEGMRIIIQYADGSLGVIERVSLKIWNLPNSPYAKVIAWMPLPEPYKEVKE